MEAPAGGATACKAYGPGLEGGNAGQPCKLTVITQDAGRGGLAVAVEVDNEAPILEPLPSPASRFNHLKMGWRKGDFQMNLFSIPKIASEQGEQETTMSPGMPSDMYDSTGTVDLLASYSFKGAAKWICVLLKIFSYFFINYVSDGYG